MLDAHEAGEADAARGRDKHEARALPAPRARLHYAGVARGVVSRITQGGGQRLWVVAADGGVLLSAEVPPSTDVRVASAHLVALLRVLDPAEGDTQGGDEDDDDDAGEEWKRVIR